MGMYYRIDAIATLPNSQKQDMHQTSTKNKQSTAGPTISKKLMVQYATRATYEKGTEKKRTEDEIKRDCEWYSKTPAHQRIVGEE